MIRTLLVNPPYSLEERYGAGMKAFGAVAEPMGLAYLGGSMRDAGLHVEILDAPALGLHVHDVVAKIADGGYQLVGMTLLTPMFSAVRQLAEAIKSRSPEVTIAVGGPHPTVLPMRTLTELSAVDIVCVGEGEKTIVEIASALAGDGELAGVRGICYRRKGEIMMTPPRAFEQDLDSIAAPARDLLPMERYRLTASRTKGSGYCPTVIVARGCPFNCQYCSHTFGRTFRHHSVGRILWELRDLKENYGVTQVNLEADTLTLDRGFISGLCEAMIREGLGLEWTCESRVDTVDEDLLKLMKKAGCWQISYGVESGSQRLLDLIQKGVTKEKVRETYALTHKTGITIRSFFMLGLPTETREESMETIRFAIELDSLWAQFTVTIPYPGTPMFQELDAKGKIAHHNWSDYNTWGGWADKRLPYITDGRTEQELKALQKEALRRYYLRPKVLIRFLSTVTSPSDLIKYARGLIVLVTAASRNLPAGSEGGRRIPTS